jgi:DDE superfamily endonuclease
VSFDVNSSIKEANESNQAKGGVEGVHDWLAIRSPRGGRSGKSHSKAKRIPHACACLRLLGVCDQEYFIPNSYDENRSKK